MGDTVYVSNEQFILSGNFLNQWDFKNTKIPLHKTGHKFNGAAICCHKYKILTINFQKNRIKNLIYLKTLRFAMKELKLKKLQKCRIVLFFYSIEFMSFWKYIYSVSHNFLEKAFTI